jgi:hypothetical protein
MPVRRYAYSAPEGKRLHTYKADLVHGPRTSLVTRRGSGFELAWRRIDSAWLAVSYLR